jgi:ribosomal protein S6
MKDSASDPECFEDSFTKWKAMAISARREFQRSGVRAVEYRINPQEFATWCILNVQENNATSRAEFVSERLSESYI